MSSILHAATDVVMEKGIEAATITAIANRSGVSRQWLYDFFPDVDSILAALYEETQREYFTGPRFDPSTATTFAEYVEKESLAFLDMPVAFAIVTSYALNGGTSKSSSGSALRDLILDSYEQAWVTPLVKIGFTREQVYASIVAITNCIVGLSIAIHEGLTSRDIAEQRVIAVVRAIVGDTEFPPGID
jgi:AcrR family transcriptional regulator